MSTKTIPCKFKPGEKIDPLPGTGRDGHYRVIAIAENWVTLRRPRCVPFVQTVAYVNTHYRAAAK